MNEDYKQKYRKVVQTIDSPNNIRIRRFGDHTIAILFSRGCKGDGFPMISVGISVRSKSDKENKWIGKFFAVTRALKAQKYRVDDSDYKYIGWADESFIPEFMKRLHPEFKSCNFLVYDQTVLDLLKYKVERTHAQTAMFV